MVKWWIMTSFTRFTFLSTEILQRLSRGANTQRPMCWKERKEPLSVFVTLNPGSLCPLFFSFLVFASEKLSLFFFFFLSPLKTAAWDSRPVFFNGHWRPTKTVAAEMKSTGGNWFFCSFGEKQSGSWKKKKKSKASKGDSDLCHYLHIHRSCFEWVFPMCQEGRCAASSSVKLLGLVEAPGGS